MGNSISNNLMSGFNVIYLNAIVRFNPHLSDFDKLLFGEMDSRPDTNDGVDFEQIAASYGKKAIDVKRSIERLKKFNFIYESVNKNSGITCFFLCRVGLAKESYEQYQLESKVIAPVEPEHPKTPVIGYVYLMIDKRSGYHKIGFSKNPHQREKTLQAEVPIIEMVFCTPATISFERELHDKYAHKRIRGEWFDLSDAEVMYIIETYREKL